VTAGNAGATDECVTGEFCILQRAKRHVYEESSGSVTILQFHCGTVGRVFHFVLERAPTRLPGGTRMGKRGRVLPFAGPEPRGKAEPALAPAQAAPSAAPAPAPENRPPPAPLPRRVPGNSRSKPGNWKPRGGPPPGFPPPATPNPNMRPDPDRVIEPGASSPEPPDQRGSARPEPPEPDVGARQETPTAPAGGLAAPGIAAAGPARPDSELPVPAPQPRPVDGDPGEPVTGPIVLRPRSETERRAAQPVAAGADSDVAPSWGAVVGTTVRLWAQRRRTRWRVAAAIVVALVVFAAGGLTVALLRKGSAAGSAGGSSSSSASLGAVHAAAVARQQAAVWVAAQVSHSAVVSCDPAMCAALQAKGFPAGDLMALGPGTDDPLGSAVIVATAAVRSLFGSRLTTVYAPTMIAGFGSGSARVDVRVYAAGGAPAYLAALKADEQSRVSVGRQLLRNSRVSVTAVARLQLASGQVDSRLLITIATLSHQGPVGVVAFGDSGPGASPGAPLREADLVAPAQAKSGYLNSMMSLLRAQQQPYLANSVTLVRLADGQQAVRIEFASPSPLGLLSG
jgi:hypothetical protein